MGLEVIRLINGWNDKYQMSINLRGETMTVYYGNYEDIESWMELVQTVRWNFPGLETPESVNEHRCTVLRFMKEQRAICVKDLEKVVGVLLFSKKHNMICCLAVLPEYRKQGIANMLLLTALKNLDRSKNITVSTFREGDTKGVAPRALYKKFGFVEGELIEEFGYPNQRFILCP
jgi:ribosomal protein S18 acetylase RimI-like enzyme